MPQVIITFDKGTATIETNGFAGPACQEATAALERALGVKVSDERTAEYYQAEAVRPEAQHVKR